MDEDHRVDEEAARSGFDRVEWMLTFAAAVYNLVRARNLLAQQAA
jgi:hypothetical protein